MGVNKRAGELEIPLREPVLAETNSTFTDSKWIPLIAPKFSGRDLRFE